MKPIYKKFIMAFVTLAFIGTGAFIAIKFANGYRPTKNGIIEGTGLLAANSFPSGAQVYINGKLTTATDDTKNLNPGSYTVEIKKDGYITWKKDLIIEKELVTQTNAVLFPSVVSLTPITQTGVSNITPSPDGTKIAYIVSDSSSPRENGLYVYHLNGGALTFRGRASQIARNVSGITLENSSILWSPDSTQLLLNFPTGNLLVDANNFNDLTAAQDVTVSLPLTFNNWEKELFLQENEKLSLLPEEMQIIATQSAKNIYFSPDEKRVMYTATAEANIPEELIPPLPATNSQTEERNLQVGAIYVYDLKEDKNFRIDTEVRPAELEGLFQDKINLVDNIEEANSILNQNQDTPLSAYNKLQEDKTIEETIQAFKLQYSPLSLNGYQWFTTSSHLIINKESAIEVVEYDGTNRASLYSGPRDTSFVYPWPDGSKLLISTNLGASDDIPLNLYAITLK